MSSGIYKWIKHRSIIIKLNIFYENKDSVVIVTGASGGIGLATARILSDRGAKVVLAARSEKILKKLEKEIPNSFAVPTDMREPRE